MKEVGYMSITIEAGVEIPSEKKKNDYPYKLMKVGDSFFVPGAKISIICNSNYRMSKMLGWKFIARKEREGIRVWRTN
jgi:hypothetical protein